MKNTRVKTKIIVTAILFIVAFGAGGMLGCGSNYAIERGFDYFGRSQNEGGFRTAVRSQRREFDINDVTLEFFFGWRHTLATEVPHERFVITSVALFFASNHVNAELSHVDEYKDIDGITLIRVIPREEAFSGEYFIQRQRRRRPWDFWLDHGGSDRIIFSHSEMITIPSEFFERERGNVRFSMWTIDFDLEQEEYLPLHIGHSGVLMHYERIEGNKIRIS